MELKNTLNEIKINKQMKSKDQILLEEAYQQIREAMDKQTPTPSDLSLIHI